MSKLSTQIPLIQRVRKRVDDWVKKLRLDKFVRGAPLSVTIFLSFLTLCSILGTVFQILVIWEYPSEMWDKTTILQNVKDGVWKTLFTIVYFNPDGIGFFSFLYVLLLGLCTWLFSTKVKQLRRLVVRYIIFAITNMVLFLKWIAWASVPVKVMWTPWIAEIMVQYLGKTEHMDKFLQDNVVWFTWGILFLPIYAVYFFAAWFSGLLMEHAERWNEWFGTYEFRHHAIETVAEMQRSGVYADICIGIYTDVAGKIKAIMRGKDRATHTIVVGSIGTGKSAAALLPLIRLDMKHVVTYINNFQTDDYETRSQRLSGMTIIDPSNDLCSKSYQLAKAHGLPDEAVFYLDPENKHSKSYNPLRGPAETVAATFVFVLEGLQPDQEDFYKNTQAVHLYNHILLLKLLHDGREEIERIIRTERPSYPDPLIPTNGKSYLTYEQIFGSNACTLDTLMKLYRDPWLVKQASRSLRLLLPKNWENEFTGDDLSYYSIIEQVTTFIDKIVVYKKTFRGEVVLYDPESPHAGDIELEDTYAEKITGLTNVLNQMASNTFFRRVMFGDSGLDLDVHLRTGGILLINTADGVMGKLSGYFAQIMLQSMVQAVYRRDISKGQPHGHHIIVDEFPKYAYLTYPDFPANARKYGGFVTIGMQTMAQMEMKFSKAYLETIIGVHRNRMVYQGVPLLDAEYFSKYFGTKKVYQVAEGKNYQAATQDSPGMSQSEKYQLVEVPRFAPHEISESKAFEAVLQLNIDNEQQVARRVKADFVPKQEFKDAKEKPDQAALRAWIDQIQIEAQKGPVTKGTYVSGLIDDEAADYLAGKDLVNTEDHMDDAPLPAQKNTRGMGEEGERREEHSPEPIPKPEAIPASQQRHQETTSERKPFDFTIPTVPLTEEGNEGNVAPSTEPIGYPNRIKENTKEMNEEIPVQPQPEAIQLEGERNTPHNLHEIDRKRMSVQEMRQQREKMVPQDPMKTATLPNERSSSSRPQKPGRVTAGYVVNNVIKHESNRRHLTDEVNKQPEQRVETHMSTPPEHRPVPPTEAASQDKIPKPFANVDLSSLMPTPASNKQSEVTQIEKPRLSEQELTAKVTLAESFALAPEPADTEKLLQTFKADALAGQKTRRRRGIGGGEED